MTVKEFIESVDKDYCNDVYDNYTEELAISYCGNKLTAEGERHFAKALELNIQSISDDCVVIEVDRDDLSGKQADKNLCAAISLFESMAGYCSGENYDKWFCD